MFPHSHFNLNANENVNVPKKRTERRKFRLIVKSVLRVSALHVLH